MTDVTPELTPEQYWLDHPERIDEYKNHPACYHVSDLTTEVRAFVEKLPRFDTPFDLRRRDFQHGFDNRMVPNISDWGNNLNFKTAKVDIAPDPYT
ncbi:MAG: hypothetical protein AAFO51_04970, partial [Pseudomonadota bacterium]